MKRIIISIYISIVFLFTGTSYCQNKDVSKIIRQYYSEDYFKGASLVENNIHITIELNETSYKWVIAASEMLGKEKSVEEVRLEKALENILKPARSIFKKIPSATTIFLYIVTITDNRDNYGHKTGEDKTVHCKFSLTKDTVQKLDWKYISTLIGSSKNNDELKGYLDSFNFYTGYL